ncbi:MAG: hypothetical protein J3Q66DRAFT_395648 [Benniella sp.]|nr:MAG: hypothetical protein J3Q66DRAFT_395648 [Benniella sp.]
MFVTPRRNDHLEQFGGSSRSGHHGSGPWRTAIRESQEHWTGDSLGDTSRHVGRDSRGDQETYALDADAAYGYPLDVAYGQEQNPAVQNKVPWQAHSYRSRSASLDKLLPPPSTRPTEEWTTFVEKDGL